LENLQSQAILNAGMLLSEPSLDMDTWGAALPFLRRYDMIYDMIYLTAIG